MAARKVSAKKRTAPTLQLENQCWENGDDIVVGIDEVGRGSWAGPLVMAAAVIPRDRRIYKLRDSKLLSERAREEMFDKVAQWCQWSLGIVSASECDEWGMAAALRVCAQRALNQLDVQPDRILIDGPTDFVGKGNSITVVKGDMKCVSIAAASIVAKVSRDRMMRAEAIHFPAYSFEANKGYPCPRHRMALNAYGPTAIHRQSWSFMDDLPWSGVARFSNEPQLFSSQSYSLVS